MGHATAPLTESSFPLNLVTERESIGRRQGQMGPRFRGDGSTRLTTRAAGFSLLEVLAAFVILALVGTALFRLFSGALGNATLADEYSRATLYAESRLAAVSVEAPLKEGTLQGNSDDGRYAWSAVVTPYTPPDSTPGFDSATTTMAVRLWKLAVTVTWPGTAGSERSVALSTVRLAVKE
jgi:general secretion pathway protein I